VRSAPTEEYHSHHPPKPLSHPERRGVSRRSVIEEAKAKVTTLELAARLSGTLGVQRGREVYFRCPLHDDHDPSLRVEPEQDVWFCDPCLVGGDAITLAQRAWDIDRADVAAAEILLTFGHEIPPRAPAWFAKQARQKPARNALEAAKILHLQRRVFRIFRPMIEEIEDEGGRREETRYLWDAAGEIAVCLWAGRRAA
jgi:hypothetical protein